MRAASRAGSTPKFRTGGSAARTVDATRREMIAKKRMGSVISAAGTRGSSTHSASRIPQTTSEALLLRRITLLRLRRSEARLEDKDVVVAQRPRPKVRHERDDAEVSPQP